MEAEDQPCLMVLCETCKELAHHVMWATDKNSPTSLTAFFQIKRSNVHRAGWAVGRLWASYYASRHGSMHMMMWLGARGYRIQPVCCVVASSLGRADMIEWLGDQLEEERGTISNKQLEAVMMRAIEHHPELAKSLILSVPLPGLDNAIALSECQLLQDIIQAGNLDMLNFFLEYAIPQHRHWQVRLIAPSMLYRTVRYGWYDIMCWIMELLGWSDVAYGAACTYWAAMTNNLPLLIYFMRKISPPDVRCAYAAAVVGNLQMLKYVECGGIPLTSSVLVGAAENGHIHILSYAHWRGCKWTTAVFTAAAQQGHVDVLAYALECGCPYDDMFLTEAVRNGKLSVLQWALGIAICFPLERLSRCAAKHGHIHIVHWLYDMFGHKGFSAIEVFIDAAVAGHYGLMQWLEKTGLPSLTDATSIQTLPDRVWEQAAIYRWCQAHKIAIDVVRCQGALKSRLQYLLERIESHPNPDVRCAMREELRETVSALTVLSTISDP